MSERERGNKIITLAIVLILNGICAFFFFPGHQEKAGYFSIIAGIIFLIWGTVLRGATHRPPKEKVLYDKKPEQSAFWYHLIIGILASIVGGFILHAVLTK